MKYNNHILKDRVYRFMYIKGIFIIYTANRLAVNSYLIYSYVICFGHSMCIRKCLSVLMRHHLRHHTMDADPPLRAVHKIPPTHRPNLSPVWFRKCFSVSMRHYLCHHMMDNPQDTVFMVTTHIEMSYI